MISKNRGFTLVELTIVFVIMSLIFGAGMTLLMAQMSASRQAETKVKQEAIRVALISFISRNNRLPCPADPALSSSAALYGTEAANPGTCTGRPASGTGDAVVVNGIVPWVSLGLPEDMGSDGFYDRFSYQVVQKATNLNAQTIPGMRGYITLHSAGPGTIGPAPTGNQINDCTNGLTYNPCAAVVVVISHGKNGHGAFTSNGSTVPATGAGADELANLDGDSLFVKKDYAESSGNPFDDSVMALTPSDLLSPLTQNGTIKDYRATLNSLFASMRNEVDGYTATHRGGLSGSIFYALPAQSNLTTVTDPWGKMISYSSISQISAATPSGVAYTLTSSGPDGSFSTADDITIAVSVSELQGILARTGF